MKKVHAFSAGQVVCRPLSVRVHVCVCLSNWLCTSTKKDTADAHGRFLVWTT